MPTKKRLVPFLAVLPLLIGFLTNVAPAWAASKEKVLHNFNHREGAEPVSNLIFDAAGNLYGTTLHGGTGGDCGTVFELMPDGKGNWKEKLLVDFDDHGCHPRAGLVIDAAGNLYGATVLGGYHGAGTVFQLTPGANGQWTYTVLHSFTGHDGSRPSASLILDSAGNLYGTTFEGGINKRGTAFELVSEGNGKWKEKVLHSFGSGNDGEYPISSLVFDASGNLYGLTCCGGSNGSSCSPNDFGCGIVFELVPRVEGSWTEKVLLNFNYKDGANSNAGLIIDGVGNLYGTTQWGGTFGPGCTVAGCGVVFELSPGAKGKWKEKVLHRFVDSDGSNPDGGLIFDASGNLYGTTFFGGAYGTGCNCGGTVFKLTPGAGGKWKETVLRSFGNGMDGEYPNASLTIDASGNFYGDTYGGGSLGYGTIFEITP